MVQAMAQGRVRSVAELRQVVAAPSEMKRYEPQQAEQWLAAFGRFDSVLCR